jgi:hypothetical protein
MCSYCVKCFYSGPYNFYNRFASPLLLQKVRGIETVATYDSKTREFIINTPCESAQKYWIGGAANVRQSFV